MQVIAGQNGIRKYRNVAGAQIRRVRGALAGSKPAPYLTFPSSRRELLVQRVSRLKARIAAAESVNPWDNVLLKNNAGQVMDYQWLFNTFGPIELHLADPVECVDGKKRVMRLIEAQESIGPAVLVVSILKEDGSPWENMCVARGWPGAPTLPGTPSETIRWSERGVYGFTNIEGDIGYGMGAGDYYWRYDTQAGVGYIFTLGVHDTGVWTPNGGIPSDFVTGTGMLGGTEHQGLLRFKYQWVVVEDDDDDDDDDGDGEDDDVIALLTEIRDLLAAGGGSFPAELDFSGKIVLPG